MRVGGKSGAVLVVGSGLAGAALAWAATRVGLQTTLTSADRPARDADAIEPGIAFGLGPPGSLVDWGRMPAEEIARHARLRETGRSGLEEALFAAERPCGLLLLEHCISTNSRSESSVAPLPETLAKLLSAGFDLDWSAVDGALRGEDGLIRPRRLTLELLRQARARGAELRFGAACLGSRPRPGGGALVDIDGQEEEFGRVYWAGERPPAGRSVPAGGPQHRIVLHRESGPGAERLDEILESDDGSLLLAPAPSRNGGALLVRVGTEAGAGRFVWPEPPPEWSRYIGPPARQRLSESFAGYAADVPAAAGGPANVTGFSGWPIASIMGACIDAIGSGPPMNVISGAAAPS